MALALEALLLLDGSECFWDGLQPAAGYGLSALVREPVRSLLYLLQRPLDDPEPVLDLFDDGGVDLAVEYIPAHVARVVVRLVGHQLPPGTRGLLRAPQGTEQLFPQAMQPLLLFVDEVLVKLAVGNHNSL